MVLQVKWMVQKEVTKKTRVYGTVAILSALILGSLIYVFGGAPGFAPNSPPSNPDSTPSGANSGANPVVSPMKSFASLEELRNYLNANSVGTSFFGGGPLDQRYFSGAPAPQPAHVPSMAAEGGTYDVNSYSTTNIQVAGVDEADIVKTDGVYIYTASNDYSNGNYVYIVKADQNDPRVVAKIPLDNDTYLAGMFLSQDSSKLVVIGSQYKVYALGAEPAMPSIAIAPDYFSGVKTFINIYDIADKVHPTLARNFTLSGSYFNSRMIGDYVYAVVSQSAYVYDNVVPLPRVYTATGAAEEIPATEVYYSDTADYSHIENSYFTFTSFYGLNLQDPSQEPTNMTVLMGGASTMYVSLDNMYVTYPAWSQGQYTSIYRVSIDNGKLTFEAKGSVPGGVLNQYSMDEYNGYFRLATTNWKDTTENTVYVLDMNLTTVGEVSLTNAEIRETIQSTRFMGDKAYVVTFEQKDPFFVLDMSNPAEPRVAGKLELPGFSSYLHPYDENHIIGLGMENSTAVKLSLFDVTNVNAPKEIARYIVQGDYTYSEALYEPKAFLFDKAKQLLVIPVSVNEYGVLNPGIPELDGGVTNNLGGFFWQGAYVFRLTLAGGFELKGTVTHSSETYNYGYNESVNRALYIGNTLYTISQTMVKLNSLTNLAPIAEVNLK
jgi:inhibitor of cysteine peptidase